MYQGLKRIPGHEITSGVPPRSHGRGPPLLAVQGVDILESDVEAGIRAAERRLSPKNTILVG